MALSERSAPKPLAKTQKSVLSEALRRGEDARDRMEGALVDYGRWLLVNVFDDDATSALEGRRDNPIWSELIARAGGPTLRVSQKLLEVAVRIAAHDKRINDDAWRLLEPGRKELLLPLGDEGSMRDVAHRVVAMKMSQRATRAFVREKLTANGKPAQSRVTVTKFRARLTRAHTLLSQGATRRRIETLLGRSTPEERKNVRDEIERIAEWAKEMKAVLRGAGA